MWKKRTLVLGSILSLLVLGTGVAYAADDTPPDVLRAAGKVTRVDPGASSFTLETLRKDTLTVVVSDSTEFRSPDGEIEGIEDLEVGMFVGVAGSPGGESVLQAKVVIVGKPGERPRRFRLGGEITGIMASDDVFTLKTRNGDEVEIKVNEHTRFLSRDDSIHSLEDLEVGMLAQVAGLKGPGGQLNALRVAAGSAEDRPDIFAQGQITAVGDHSFTLQSRDGRRLTFEVNESTRFRSRDGSVKSFEDLEIGMHAAVAGDELSEGSYTAIVVGVGKPGRQPEGNPAPPLPSSSGA